MSKLSVHLIRVISGHKCRATWGIIQSLLTTSFCFAICLHTDLPTKRLLNGMANLQMKACKENWTTSVLKITKEKISLKNQKTVVPIT